MTLPRKRPTGDIKDILLVKHIEDLQEDSLGNILELSAAPTAAVPLLGDNEIGKFGSNIYFRIGSTILVFTADSSITIT